MQRRGIPFLRLFCGAAHGCTSKSRPGHAGGRARHPAQPNDHCLAIYFFADSGVCLPTAIPAPPAPAAGRPVSFQSDPVSAQRGGPALQAAARAHSEQSRNTTLSPVCGCAGITAPANDRAPQVTPRAQRPPAACNSVARCGHIDRTTRDRGTACCKLQCKHTYAQSNSTFGLRPHCCSQPSISVAAAP